MSIPIKEKDKYTENLRANNPLELYGPVPTKSQRKDWQRMEYVAVKVLAEYIEWIGYKRGLASAAIERNNFEEYSRQIDDINLCRQFINLESAAYPKELAYNIIIYRARTRKLPARQIYHELRRAAAWYSRPELDRMDGADFEIEAAIFQCLQTPDKIYTTR